MKNENKGAEVPRSGEDEKIVEAPRYSGKYMQFVDFVCAIGRSADRRIRGLDAKEELEKRNVEVRKLNELLKEFSENKTRINAELTYFRSEIVVQSSILSQDNEVLRMELGDKSIFTKKMSVEDVKFRQERRDKTERLNDLVLNMSGLLTDISRIAKGIDDNSSTSAEVQSINLTLGDKLAQCYQMYDVFRVLSLDKIEECSTDIDSLMLK